MSKLKGKCKKLKTFLKGSFYAYFYKFTAIKEKTVLYEAFFGRGLLDSPYALFNECLSDERFAGYTHVWSIDKKEDIKKLKKEYKAFPNVKFVCKKKPAYLKWLSRAQYLINNVSFPNYFTKKSGQVYINTWHGIPLKSLGFDMKAGKTEVSNVLRNMLQTDYMISACPFLTHIYEKAYKLDGLYEGGIIEEGYPRLDTIAKSDRNAVIKKLRSLGVNIDGNKEIILYAPTWRGENYAHAIANAEELGSFKKELEKRIDTKRYQVLVKPHQRVFELAADEFSADFFVPAAMEANEMLSVTDILVSDYSSIFYDYLYTGKPILFYIEDPSAYDKEHGTYATLEEALPGPHVGSVSELSELIRDIESVNETWSLKYAEVKAFARADIKENISSKILDIVFFGKESDYSVKRLKNTKPRILISRGVLGVNGISTAVLNLLNCIDYDRYDITFHVDKSRKDLTSGFIERINDNARVMYKTWQPAFTIGEAFSYLVRRYIGLCPYSKAFERELKRTYGDSKFERVIDYGGFNHINATLAVQNTGAKRYIWLHNDMISEYKTRFPALKNIFSMYKYFDGAVACGREVMDINREKFPEKYKLRERLLFAANAINYKRILDMACEKTTYFDDEISTDEISFITIGRKSPEKNHAELIKAFARFNAECKNSRLFILGDGKLKYEIDAQITALGLNEKIVAPGNVPNPYSILNRCSCFILPSLYEGLPIVVLEARVLHKPVILSDFGSAKECCIENGQLMCGHDADSIYEAMMCFKNKQMPVNYTFDPDEYNSERMNEFYKAINI